MGNGFRCENFQSLPYCWLVAICLLSVSFYTRRIIVQQCWNY